MRKVVVLGSTGFVGRRLTQALVQKGFGVRCSVRDPLKAAEILPKECEIIPGDISDEKSMFDAVKGVEAVYVSIHTLRAQPKSMSGESFVDTEIRGLGYLVKACLDCGVGRIIYVTQLGAAPDAELLWARGRWKAEQLLLKSGLNATILRPGQIVGKGGGGFGRMMAQAGKRFAIVPGSGKQKYQNIAVDDLVYYLTQALDEPGTYGKAFDVGSDEILTYNEMIDIAARVMGKPAPIKIHLPLFLLKPFAPFLERAIKLPKGSFGDLIKGMETDYTGDTQAIKAIIPYKLLNYEDAVGKVLKD
jgi:NADH dehydrogenase